MDNSASLEYPYPKVIEYPTISDLQGIYQASVKILLTGYDLDYESQAFLSDNPDVALELPRIGEIIHALFKSHISPSFEIIVDEESLVVRRLGIIYSFENRTFDEVLDLWTDASKKIYSEMDPTTAKKISILIDGDKNIV